MTTKWCGGQRSYFYLAALREQGVVRTKEVSWGGAEESCSVLGTVGRGTNKWRAPTCAVERKGRPGLGRHVLEKQQQGLWGSVEKKVKVEERWGMITDSKV